jgi:tetratricopeptide (TPR) repeat protein
VARYVAWLGHRLGRPRVVEGQPLFDAAVVTPLIDEVVQGWALAMETGEAAAMLWLLGALVSWHEANGEFEGALRRLAPALEALDESMPAEAATLTALQVARASLTYRAGDFEVAARLGLDAHRRATRTGQVGLGRLGLNIVGLSRWMQARLPEAQAAFEQALASAAASDDLSAQRRLEGNLALVEKAQGRYAAAEARWRRGLDLAMIETAWGAAVSYLNNLGNLLRQQGRLDECEPLAIEALRLCHQHGLDGIRPFALIGLALLHAAKGQRDTAREYLDLVESSNPANMESSVEAGAAQLRATLALEEGAQEQAHEHIVRALKICQRHDDGANRAEALEIHGRWLWAQGRRREAEALWRTLLKAPSISAVLRDRLNAHLQTHGLSMNDDGPSVDTALVVERLLTGR